LLAHDSELLAERDEILKTRQILLLLPNSMLPGIISRLWISFPRPVCAEDEVRTEQGGDWHEETRECSSTLPNVHDQSGIGVKNLLRSPFGV
jgi:hypothetical protein